VGYQAEVLDHHVGTDLQFLAVQRTCMDAQFHRVRQKKWEGNGDNPVSQYPPTREKSFNNE
jgi:hypothetical protein